MCEELDFDQTYNYKSLAFKRLLESKSLQEIAEMILGVCKDPMKATSMYIVNFADLNTTQIYTQIRVMLLELRGWEGDMAEATKRELNIRLDRIAVALGL